MLRSRKEKQQGMEVVILEQMVPENHLLRKIDRSIDFSFINKLCAPLYSENVGRPAVDPEILFRMLFVGYLYGIRSERRLEEEINYNFAYKWFCGLGLTEKAPDATTISVNRTRRFRDNNIAEKIFQEILRQAVEKKLVGGEILYTDSTHVKAKANKHKKTTVTIEKSPKAYMEELDAAIAADRDALGKKPFEKKDDDEPPTTQIQQSKNDPESGQLHKEGKPDGFHYSEHRTVDSKNNIVVNVRITPANVNDVDPVTDILDDIEKRLGHLPSYMGVDAGYHNAPTCHQIASRGIQPVVGYRRHTHKGEHWGKYHFVYQKDKNVYLCPQKHELTWKTTNRAGYREYWSDSKVCSNCPCREKCLSSSMTRRLVTRHVWQDDLEQADTFTKTLNGKRIYAWRKQTIERSFAEAKELHGLRYARMLGIRNMYEQSFLTAAVQNMKRIARAFRFPFSLLILCIGAAFGRKRPLSQRSASAAPTVCARRPNGRRAQRVEKAGAARLFRHAVASPGALRRGPPVGWHRTYTILRRPGTRRISHAAASARANTASSHSSAAASGVSAPHSGRNSRSCVWAISQSCARYMPKAQPPSSVRARPWRCGQRAPRISAMAEAALMAVSSEGCMRSSMNQYFSPGATRPYSTKVSSTLARSEAASTAQARRMRPRVGEKKRRSQYPAKNSPTYTVNSGASR